MGMVLRRRGHASTAIGNIGIHPVNWPLNLEPGTLNPLSLITFDIDDTLYSSTDFVRLARTNAIKSMLQCGLKIDFKTAFSELEEIVAEFTSNDNHHFDRLLQRMPQHCLDGINPAVFVATGIAAYHDTVHDSFLPYEDALEAFRRLHELKFTLGVVSQGYTVKQAEKLVRLRIVPYLDRRALFFSDQVGTSKSNPKFYQRAAEALGFKAGRCMHVGDRPDRDVDSANRAGWVTVLNRRCGRYHERPGETPPAFTIDNFYDLIEVIEKNFVPG